MRKFLIGIVLLLAWGGAAHADLITRSGTSELRLFMSPCVHAGILGQLNPEWRPKFRQGQLTLENKPFMYACWIDTGEGAYYVLLENGNDGLFPITAFIEQPGI